MHNHHSGYGRSQRANCADPRNPYHQPQTTYNPRDLWRRRRKKLYTEKRLYWVYCNLQKYSDFSLLPAVFLNLSFHIKSFVFARSLCLKSEIYFNLVRLPPFICGARLTTRSITLKTLPQGEKRRKVFLVFLNFEKSLYQTGGCQNRWLPLSLLWEANIRPLF